MLHKDLEFQQRLQEKRQKELDEQSITCVECGSQYFELISARKYQLHHQVIIGQDVPHQQGIGPYKVLRCVRCGSLIEPRISYSSRDLVQNNYGKFVDTMEGKSDKRPAELQELKSEELKELRELIKKEDVDEVSDKE